MKKFNKEEYRGMVVNGYRWTYFDKGVLVFHKTLEGQYPYSVIECEERQVYNGDLEFMTQHGMTITKERKQAIITKYLRENP